PIYEPRLVEEKIHAPALRAQVRLAVFAPQACPRADVEGQLRRLLAAYRQYDLASGNGFVSRPLPPDEIAGAGGLQSLQFFGSQRHVPILNTRELAGLWHLPQALSDVPLLERTAARERLPLPGTAADGCRVGVSRHQGREVPVRLPDTLLSRHHLLVGKTRRGKSSLLSHIALHLMAPPNSGERKRGVLLVDPQSDLARSVLGAVPAARQNDVVFLDLGHEARCAAEPAAGPSQQHTVLEILALLVDGSFRKLVLQSVRDPVVRQWWRGYFDMLERKQQLEIINPVQSKIQRYAGNELARNIIGQPRTTIDPRAWVREGKIVIVDGAKSAAGEDTCALVGAAVINLAGLALADQGTLAPAARRRLTLLADEIHTMPGADFEAYLSELAKYGANAVLATQGLGRLEALDRKETGRALRPTLFSNIDGLFVFQVSAEDARYLVHELGVLEEEDLVALASYHCYARVSIDGEKLPTFSLHLDPPLSGNPAVASALATRSQHDCGRNRIDVEEDLRLAMVRVESASSARRSGGAFDDASDTGGTTRNEHRPNKKPKPAPKGPTLFDSQ
ncbi:MAG TPA: type IV secretory system conjugative DNA transfer family protein, partial [Chloroflexota bacterium]|nr:type IV secretory system conjugative DNA transfer family protein [Chloroflexota bacterium]